MACRNRAVPAAKSSAPAGGSTSDLTEQGRLLLQRYLAYEQALRDQARELYENYFGGLLE